MLAGFADISHWVSFLLFSVYAGALADRFDCRKLIQISQGLFALASFALARPGSGTARQHPHLRCVLALSDPNALHPVTGAIPGRGGRHASASLTSAGSSARRAPILACSR